MDVIFILDGMPHAGEQCAVQKCWEPAAGVYEVCDAETSEYLLTVALCAYHGQKLATGTAAA